MHDFILREIKETDIETELRRIGFDKTYANRAVDKYNYKNIKIYDLSPAQANILKQTAISVGCDCATHREVITGKVEKSNCILGGSVSQIKKISEKLQFQPFGLKILGELLNKKYVIAGCDPQNSNYYAIPKQVRYDDNYNYPKIVGILNITDNSFSDGGLYNDFESAKKHLLEMISDGADVIDIGAESTKPYSQAVCAEEQLKKLLPIIDFAKDKTKISIDTRSATVAEECIKAGAHIINDVSGFDYDEKMADTIAKYNVPVIIQHSKGTPENMQNSPHYEDVVEEIFLALREKINFARSKGIENIIVDPGIGFGKTRENNFEIIRRIEEFKNLGYPVMLGCSRKSFLQTQDDTYTAIFNALAIERNVDYIRVHNVKMHKNLLDLMKMFMVK